MFVLLLLLLPLLTYCLPYLELYSIRNTRCCRFAISVARISGAAVNICNAMPGTVNITGRIYNNNIIFAAENAMCCMPSLHTRASPHSHSHSHLPRLFPSRSRSFISPGPVCMCTQCVYFGSVYKRTNCT